jgi:hypothetical protein
MLPNVAKAQSNLIPLEDFYRAMRTQFQEWDIESYYKKHVHSYIPLIFTEEELRAYVEMSVDWMNARLEGEQVNEFLPGDPEQIVGDTVYTDLEEESRLQWQESVLWMAITHAMFSLALNYVCGEAGGERIVTVDPDPEFMRLKLEAEARHETTWELFLAQANRQYLPS